MQNVFLKPPVSPTDKSIFSQTESRYNSNYNSTASNQFRHTENLLGDLEQFYSEIVQTGPSLLNVPQKEKFEWVSRQQAQLSQFVRRLDSTTFPNQSTMSHCQNLIQSVDRLLREFLSVPALGNSALHRRLSSSPSKSVPAFNNNHNNNNNSSIQFGGSSASNYNQPQPDRHSSMQTSQVYFPGKVPGMPSIYDDASTRKRTFQSTMDFQESTQRREGGSVQFNQTTINNHHNNRVDSIRQRQDRLDRDFMQLMERYNHSQVLIENIDIQNKENENFSSPQQQHQQPPVSSEPQSVRNSNIQSSQKVSPIHYQSNGNLQRSTMNINDDLSFIPQSRKSSSKYMNSVRDSIVQGSKDESVAQSIYKLKETISFKENLDKEKLWKARNLNRELKINLQQYLDKNQYLEENLKRKDEILMKLESEIKLCQEQLLISMEKLREMKTREEGLLRLEDEIRDSNNEIKEKLSQKKRKLEEMREIIDRNENTLRDYERKIENLQSILTETNESMNDYKSKIIAFGEENNQYQEESNSKQSYIAQIQEDNRALKSEVKETTQKLEIQLRAKSELIRQKDHFQSQNEELTEVMKQLEAKFQRHKAKHEEEKNLIINTQNEEITKAKTKNKSLKSQVAEYEQILSEFKTKNIEISKELEHQGSLNRDYERTISELQEALKSTQNQVQNMNEKKNSQSSDLQQCLNEIRSLQEELKLMDNRLQNESHFNMELKSENSVLNQKLENIKEYAAKLESQLQFEQQRQNSEISEIENQVELLIREIGDLQIENSELKKKQVDMKKEINKEKETSEQYKDKFLKTKANNQTLRLHIQQVQEKVKDYMTERMFELRETEKVKEVKQSQESLAQNKLRVLEEIQTMIRSHRGNLGSMTSQFD